MAPRLLIIVLAICVLGFASTTAYATPYEFEDEILFDPAHIYTARPLFYWHDITDDVDFGSGDFVTDATLELVFVNDEGDSFLVGIVDRREFAGIGFDHDGSSWSYFESIGEIDDGQYDISVGVDLLNDDGILNVGLGVWNLAKSADMWLASSTLSGHASTPNSPVPEPATIFLFGSGLLGLAALRKGRLIPKRPV